MNSDISHFIEVASPLVIQQVGNYTDDACIKYVRRYVKATIDIHDYFNSLIVTTDKDFEKNKESLSDFLITKEYIKEIADILYDCVISQKTNLVSIFEIKELLIRYKIAYGKISTMFVIEARYEGSSQGSSPGIVDFLNRKNKIIAEISKGLVKIIIKHNLDIYVRSELSGSIPTPEQNNGEFYMAPNILVRDYL